MLGAPHMPHRHFLAQVIETWRIWAQTFHKPLLLMALSVFMAGIMWSMQATGVSPAKMHWWSLAMLISMAPASLFYSGFGLQLMAKAAGVNIPLKQAAYTSAVAILADVLPLPGSAIIRTHALMKAGARLTQGSLLVFVTAILWIALGVLGAGFALLNDHNESAWFLIAIGLASSSLTCGYLWQKSGKVLTFLTLFHRLMGIALIALRLHLAFRVFGTPLPILQIMPIVLATIAGSASAIAPAGLGVSEALAALAANATNIPPGAAFLAVGADRFIHIFVSWLATASPLFRGWIKQSHRHAGF